VEKVSKFVNKSHAIYAYIITSEELGSMSYEGRKLKKIGTGITNGSKNGCVPPVNLRSESANII
jgi:hypothetical protein